MTSTLYPIVQDALKLLAKKRKAIKEGNGDKVKRYAAQLAELSETMTAKAIEQFNREVEREAIAETAAFFHRKA